MGRSPSTVSAALGRLEAAIAAPLVRREGANFVLTLEAEKRVDAISAARAAVRDLMLAAGRADGFVPSISVEVLRRFSVVAHQGSIRSAAQSLGVGQPQLTRQMADLERKLGVSLLDRARSGVNLTAAGRLALPHAESIVSGWEEVSEAASQRFRRDIMTWRIGTVMPLGHESSIARMLANLVVAWGTEQKRHPLFISTGPADELVAGLKSRRFDLVVVDHAQVPQDFLFLEISRSPLALVGDASIIGPSPDIRQLLRKHRLALPSVRSGIRQEAMRYLEQMLGSERAVLDGVVEVDSIPVIINLVALHGYLSILPQMSLVRLPFSLRHISLAPERLQRLVMVWRRSGLPQPLLDAVRRSVEQDEAVET